MFSLLQAAAQAVAVTSPPVISTGEWIALTGLGLSVAAALVTFGKVISDTKHHRETTETALADVRKNVGESLARMERTLDQISAAMAEQTTRQIENAGWAATLEADVATARKDAEEAKGVAHRARNIAQTGLDTVNALLPRLEGLEGERRTGTPDRRA